MSTEVHFDCQNCGRPYLATRELLPDQMSGTINCVSCGKVAHKWTGTYNLTDWRPVRMNYPSLLKRP